MVRVSLRHDGKSARGRWTGALCALVFATAACSGSGSGGKAGAGGNANGGSSAGGTGASAGATSGTGGSGQAGASGASSVVTGGPGCGFDSAAFCDSFDAPSTQRGRAGELDVGLWSAGRMEPQLPSVNGQSLAIGKATLPTCRAGLAAQVYPDDDALICDPTSAVASNHLLVAVAAQNYGQNSYRIRRPFDFAGRTGKIVFDAEGYLESPLLGWISVAVTEDPTAVPSFAVGGSGTYNDEGAIVPRNGIDLEFQNNCAGIAAPPVFALRMLNVYNEYKDTQMAPATPVCISGQKGQLNHFELDVSQSKVDVYSSEPSTDGKTFADAKLLYSADVNLPFSRGYVTISVHNHATIKYSTNNAMDAWTARWDNVGFDGPVIGNWREYEVADSLVMVGGEMDVGYRVADAAAGPSSKLALKGVNLDGVVSAALVFSSWYPPEYASPNGYDQYLLEYRLNGGAWRDRPFTPGEISVLTGGNCQGAIAQRIDLTLSDLRAGDNTLEFVSKNIGQGYPPVVANLDLILTTK